MFIRNNGNGKNSLRRSPRAHPKCVPPCNPEINKSVNLYQDEKTNANIDLKYPPKSDIQINSYEVATQEQQPVQTDVIEQRNAIASHFLQHTFANNQDNDENLSQMQLQQKQQQPLSKALHEKLEQRKHETNKLLQSKTFTGNCCTVIYKGGGAVAAADVQENCGGEQQTQQGQPCLIADNLHVELTEADKTRLDESQRNKKDGKCSLASSAKPESCNDFTR